MVFVFAAALSVLALAIVGAELWQLRCEERRLAAWAKDSVAQIFGRIQ